MVQYRCRDAVQGCEACRVAPEGRAAGAALRSPAAVRAPARGRWCIVYSIVYSGYVYSGYGVTAGVLVLGCDCFTPRCSCVSFVLLNCTM